MANPATVALLLLDRCDNMIIGTPPLAVAMPDVAFTPPVDETTKKALTYLRVDLFMNAQLWQGLSTGSIDQGLLQITVVSPEGRGVIRPLEIVQQVRQVFPKGLRLFGFGTRVKISGEPYAATPIPGDVSTDTPITIPWVAS